MADITKCDGHECPRKEECYRYKALPTVGGWQAFFVASPLNPETKECEMFYELE